MTDNSQSAEPVIRASGHVWSRSNVIASDCNNEIVLLNIDRGRCYGLNRVGSNIWRKMAAPVCVSDLISQIQSQFKGLPEAAEREIIEFLEQLAAEGLIESNNA